MTAISGDSRFLCFALSFGSDPASAVWIPLRSLQAWSASAPPAIAASIGLSAWGSILASRFKERSYRVEAEESWEHQHFWVEHEEFPLNDRAHSSLCVIPVFVGANRAKGVGAARSRKLFLEFLSEGLSAEGAFETGPGDPLLADLFAALRSRGESSDLLLQKASSRFERSSLDRQSSPAASASAPARSL